MSLSSQAIKERDNYVNEWAKLRTNIRQMEIWISNKLAEFLEGFDITPQQFSMLKILRQANNEPLSTKELAELMINKNSDTSRMVKRLIEKKLVRKRKSPEDGRLVQVFIAYNGLKILAKIDDQIHHLDEKFSLLSESEAERLNFLLEKARM